MAELNGELNGANHGAEGANGNPPADPTVTGDGNGKGTEKTYTQADFDKALKSETERRVTDALKTARSNWETDLTERIGKERAAAAKEAAERAKMTAEQIAAADAEKAQKAFEAERAQYRKEKLEFDVTQKLAEKKLPVKFSKYISAMGAENVEENIKELEGLLSENRQSIVNELTKGSAPHGGGGKPTETDPFLAGFGK